MNIKEKKKRFGLLISTFVFIFDLLFSHQMSNVCPDIQSSKRPSSFFRVRQLDGHTRQEDYV